MDRKEWFAIVEEAEARFVRSVDAVVAKHPAGDTAVEITKLAAELIEVFATHLANVGRERLP